MDLLKLLGETRTAWIMHGLTMAVGILTLIVENHLNVPHAVQALTVVQWIKGHINVAVQPQK